MDKLAAARTEAAQRAAAVAETTAECDAIMRRVREEPAVVVRASPIGPGPQEEPPDANNPAKIIRLQYTAGVQH